MNLSVIKKIKGFMPNHEGMALCKWAEKFSKLGHVLEIGTYCGKSSIYLSFGAKKNNKYIFTIDHHKGSEEHQINQEYFDDEIYDKLNERVDTFPLLIENINKLKINNIVPIIGSSKEVSSCWKSKISMLFIDGGHSFESANSDYECWESKIINGGCLVIHDIFENPNEGGQAPYEIYQKALKNNYTIFERVDTTICLIKG
ncbi:MAG: class I SAM-dependent methyltransferase [Pseudomonadota bacterium]|nr:class I SAM-dependent methyltransferase [Pseudomonadota bacterium]